MMADTIMQRTRGLFLDCAFKIHKNLTAAIPAQYTDGVLHRLWLQKFVISFEDEKNKMLRWAQLIMTITQF